MKISKRNWQIIELFIAWRFITLFLSLVIISIFDVSGPLKSYGEINIFKLWGNWDGGHYIGIAENGYAHIMQYAFFPLYPILIKTVHFIIPDFYFSALLVSNLALLGTLIMFYKTAKLYGLSENAAFKTILFLLVFPSAFFLGAAFTESLFLLLVISALYFAKTNQWFKASLLAGLATFTKFIAVAILIVLIVEYFKQTKISLKNIHKRIFSTRIDEPIVYLLFFGPLGIYLYSLYLFWTTGYWFFFRDAQMHWGRSTTLVNPFAVFNEKAREYLLADNFGYYNFSIHSLEVITVALFVCLIPFIYKKFGFGLAVYSLIITVFTLLSGKTDSSIRYVLTAFPFFMLFGSWAEKDQTLNFILTLSFTSLFSIMLVLFLTGNWVG